MATKQSTLSDLSAEYVRTLFDYCPETGVLRWRRRPDKSSLWNSKCAHKEAGAVYRPSPTRTYRTVAVDYRKYLVHRIIWLHVHGQWPDGEIDHADGDGLNNRIANLRLATRTQQLANSHRGRRNRTGFKGVSWNTQRQRYQAKIQRERKVRHLGFFNDPAEAHAAYCRAARELFGEFAHAGES